MSVTGLKPINREPEPEPQGNGDGGCREHAESGEDGPPCLVTLVVDPPGPQPHHGDAAAQERRGEDAPASVAVVKVTVGDEVRQLRRIEGDEEDL